MASRWLKLMCLAIGLTVVCGMQPKALADFIAVNNTGVPELSPANLSTPTDMHASSFTTGATPYNLVSLTAIFESDTSLSRTFEASIYSDGGGLPWVLLHTLSGQATLPGSSHQFLTFTSGGYAFNANTTYWAAFRSVNGDGPDQGVIPATILSQFSPVSWTINANRSYSIDGGGDWNVSGSTPLKFYVTVNTEAPEPASLGLLALGGTIMLRRRR